MPYKISMRCSPFAPLTLLSVLACSGGADQGLMTRLNETSAKVVECQKEIATTKDQVRTLKRQLAEAMANPSKVVLTDPDIIELVAQVKAARAAAGGARSEGTSDEVKIGKGDLNPSEASRIVLQGAGAMQVCYERALKKNASLQYQAGVGVVLGIIVKPTGSVGGVEVTPSVDREMTQCIKAAVTHWKFPKFAGGAVTIEQKISLTPKT